VHSTERDVLELIQIFRGAAALLVVLYHAGASNHVYYPYLGNVFRFGHSGVDFFFVLSGFIMLYVHYARAGDVRQAWRFLALRAVRIYPIYWIVLAVTVAAFWWFGQTPEHIWAPPTTLQAGTLIPAIFLTYTASVIIPPVWTLTYELAFYLFFTLFFLCGARLFTLFALLWCAAIVLQWSGLVRLGSHPVVLRPIVLEFFLGCLAAFLIRRFRPRVWGWWLLLPCALLGALAGAEWLGAVDPYTWYAAPYFLFILLGAAYDQATRRRYPPVLVLLGEASYAIYLVHFGMIMVFDATIHWFRPLADRSPHVTLTVLVLVILAVGTVLHLAVERPLLATARRAVGRPAVFPEPAALTR
jgi:peptidoglycan/LPS O-acetylase OafA/YrhL